MREADLYAKLDTQAKRIGMIYRQMVFIDTRLQSFESVMSFSNLWDRIKWLFSSSRFISSVDKLHLELMKKHDEDLKKEAEEQKLKPKLTLLTGSMNGR